MSDLNFKINTCLAVLNKYGTFGISHVSVHSLCSVFIGPITFFASSEREWNQKTSVKMEAMFEVMNVVAYPVKCFI